MAEPVATTVQQPVAVDVQSVSPELTKEIRKANHPVGPTGLRQQDQEMDPSIPAQTTYQEDLVAQGQRQINLIWERTQAVIAVFIVMCNMVVATYQGVLAGAPREHPVILSSSLFLVIGFYFSRTNHAAIGGVGKKNQPEMPYTGR